MIREAMLLLTGMFFSSWLEVSDFTATWSWGAVWALQLVPAMEAASDEGTSPRTQCQGKGQEIRLSQFPRDSDFTDLYTEGVCDQPDVCRGTLAKALKEMGLGYKEEVVGGLREIRTSWTALQGLPGGFKGLIAMKVVFLDRQFTEPYSFKVHWVAMEKLSKSGKCWLEPSDERVVKSAADCANRLAEAVE